MQEHVLHRLDAYLEEMLDPRTLERFDRHVAVCGSCRKALVAAREARQCIEWLKPTEAPPVPGPEFYVRVQQSIDKRLSRNWFENFGAVMHPRLAYPLVFLSLLTAAWTLTSDVREPEEEGLAAMEFSAPEFTALSFSHLEREASEDVVMMSLVALPEEF